VTGLQYRIAQVVKAGIGQCADVPWQCVGYTVRDAVWGLCSLWLPGCRQLDGKRAGAPVGGGWGDG